MQKSFTKCLHFLHIFDIFAVPFTPSLSSKSNQAQHSSEIGGFVSLIVYSISCYYGISIMVQWISNQMVLKVQTSQPNYDNQLYRDAFSQKNNITHFEFKAYSNDRSGPDPFKNNEALLIPILIDPYEPLVKNLLEFHNETSGALAIDWQNSMLDTDIRVIFVQCIGNEIYLEKNQTCGSQEQTDYFYNQEGLEIRFQAYVENIDLVTETKNTQFVSTITFLQKEFSTEKVVSLQFSYYDISQAILFENPHNYILTTSYGAKDQMSTREYLTGKYRNFLPEVKDVSASFMIVSNLTVNHTIVRAPTISEVLAQIGSILQTLLLIRYVVQYLNCRLMHADFKSFFVEVFFPEIKQIKKQGFGKNRKYFLNSQQIEQKSYQEFKKKTDQLIEEKLNFVNLIYEVSKMQAVLEEISINLNIYPYHLKNCHVQLELMPIDNVYRIVNSWNERNSKTNNMFQTKLFPFAFNYSLNNQFQNYYLSLNDYNIESNQQKNQTKNNSEQSKP